MDHKAEVQRGCRTKPQSRDRPLHDGVISNMIVCISFNLVLRNPLVQQEVGEGGQGEGARKNGGLPCAAGCAGGVEGIRVVGYHAWQWLHCCSTGQIARLSNHLLHPLQISENRARAIDVGAMTDAERRLNAKLLRQLEAALAGNSASSSKGAGGDTEAHTGETIPAIQAGAGC